MLCIPKKGSMPRRSGSGPSRRGIDWANKTYVRGYKAGFQRAKRYYEDIRMEATDLAKQVMKNEIERHLSWSSNVRKLQQVREGNAQWKELA
jgi:thymidylate synthase ThyX